MREPPGPPVGPGGFVLLVAPLVFRAPRGLFCWAGPLCVPVGGVPPARSPHASLGLGWLWRHWCSGRLRARPPARSPHASLRLGVVDLEARPAAARRHCAEAPQAPRRPAREIATSEPWAWLVVASLVFRVPSGPAAREIATREPAARSGRSRSPPWPSGPSGTLRTGGACGAVCGGVSSRSLARPCGPRGEAPQAPRRPPKGSLVRWYGSLFRNVACNSPPTLCWFVSVCSVSSLVFVKCMRLLPAGPAAAQRHRGEALRTLSALRIDETGCVRG